MKALTPRGWVLAVMSVVSVMSVLFILTQALGFRWDPLDLAGRRLRTEQARNATLETDLAARRLERDQAAEGQARADARHTLRTELGRATSAAETLSRKSDDADQSLDADRVERLRAHDRRLCELSPGLCADRAPEGAAADGGVANLPSSTAG